MERVGLCSGGSDTATGRLREELECHPLRTRQLTGPTLWLFFHSAWCFCFLILPSPAQSRKHLVSVFLSDQDEVMRTDPDAGCCRWSCDRSRVTAKGLTWASEGRAG